MFIERLLCYLCRLDILDYYSLYENIHDLVLSYQSWGARKDALCKNLFANTRISKSNSLFILLFDKKFPDKFEYTIKLKNINLEKCNLIISFNQQLLYAIAKYKKRKLTTRYYTNYTALLYYTALTLLTTLTTTRYSQNR